MKLAKIRLSILLISISFLAFDCRKDDPVEELNVCGVSDPVNELNWLHDEYKQFLGGADINGIILYKYDGQYVIEVQNSLFSSTNLHQHYCDGTKLDFQAPKTFEDFIKNRTLVRILYGVNIWG